MRHVIRYVPLVRYLAFSDNKALTKDKLSGKSTLCIGLVTQD